MHWLRILLLTNPLRLVQNELFGLEVVFCVNGKMHAQLSTNILMMHACDVVIPPLVVSWEQSFSMPYSVTTCFLNPFMHLLLILKYRDCTKSAGNKLRYCVHVPLAYYIWMLMQRHTHVILSNICVTILSLYLSLLISFTSYVHIAIT